MSERSETTLGALLRVGRGSYGPLIFPWGSGGFHLGGGPLMIDLRVLPSLTSGIHIAREARLRQMPRAERFAADGANYENAIKMETI